MLFENETRETTYHSSREGTRGREFLTERKQEKKEKKRKGEKRRQTYSREREIIYAGYTFVGTTKLGTRGAAFSNSSNEKGSL